MKRNSAQIRRSVNSLAVDLSTSGMHGYARRLRRYQTEAAQGERVMIGVMASLNAAISLLERTPSAKMAAPSGKMFKQMIVDYKRSLEEARRFVFPEKLTPRKIQRKSRPVYGSADWVRQYGQIDE